MFHNKTPSKFNIFSLVIPSKTHLLEWREHLPVDEDHTLHQWRGTSGRRGEGQSVDTREGACYSRGGPYTRRSTNAERGDCERGSTRCTVAGREGPGLSAMEATGTVVARQYRHVTAISDLNKWK